MNAKKAVRAAFRKAIFERDGYRCRKCGNPTVDPITGLDAHHITDRNDPAFQGTGGYVVENGISLCQSVCHPLAEQHHRTGEAHPGYAPDDLYALIGSSQEQAVAASLSRLG